MGNVDRIVLVETSRSVRRWEGERAARMGPRLDAVVREASKQARRHRLLVLANESG